MFLYTRAYFQKLISDFKLIGYLFNVFSPIVYILYLIYAINNSLGYLWANITLLSVTVLYLVFFITTYDIKAKSFKGTKRTVRHIFKGIKLSVTALTLGITIYGIYTATIHTTVLSVVLSCFMVVFWVMQTAIELITYFIEFQADLFMAAIKADATELIKPVAAVGNFVKRVTGKETSSDEPKTTNKILRILDKTVEKIKMAKEKKKASAEQYDYSQRQDEEFETSTK